MGDERPGTFNNGEEDGGGLRIGEILQEARRERGLSLHEVEQATKIRKRYLEGLEREDYCVLPDAVYVQGFLKTYANYLGLDGERLSQELKRRRSPRRERRMNHAVPGSSGFDKPLISPGGLAEAERSRLAPAVALTLAVVLLVAAVIGALYYVGQSSQRASSPPEQQASPAAGGGERPAEEAGGGQRDGGEAQRGPAPEQQRRAEERQPAAGEEANAGEVSPETLEVLVSVEGAPSWMSIQSDGSVVYEGIAEPGFSQTFEASQEVTLTTGNAGAVRVEVNGQSVGVLGGDGEVLTRSWTLKDAG